MGTKIEGGVIDGLTITTPERRKCRAKRYAIKFNPPCLFLEYEDALRKRRVRAVKINSLSDSVKVDDLTRKVIKSFPRVLDPDSVKYDQVKNLIQQLINNYKALKATEKAAHPKSNADAAPESVDVNSTLESKHPTSASAESQEKAKSKAKDLELKLFMNDANTLAHSSGDTNILERESAPSKASPSSTRSSPSTFSSGGQDDLDECGVDHDRSEPEVARSSGKDLIDDSSPSSSATIPSTLVLGSTPAAIPGKGDGQSLAAAAAAPLPRRLGGLPSLAPIGVSSPVVDRLKALPPLHSPSSTLLGGGGALAPLKGPLGLGKERPTPSLLDSKVLDEAKGGKEEEEEEKDEEEEEEEEKDEEEEEEEEDEHNAKNNDVSKQEDEYHHGDDESTEEEEDTSAKEVKGVHGRLPTGDEELELSDDEAYLEEGGGETEERNHSIDFGDRSLQSNDLDHSLSNSNVGLRDPRDTNANKKHMYDNFDDLGLGDYDDGDDDLGYDVEDTHKYKFNFKFDAGLDDDDDEDDNGDGDDERIETGGVDERNRDVDDDDFGESLDYEHRGGLSNDDDALASSDPCDDSRTKYDVGKGTSQSKPWEPNSGKKLTVHDLGLTNDDDLYGAAEYGKEYNDDDDLLADLEDLKGLGPGDSTTGLDDNDSDLYDGNDCTAKKMNGQQGTKGGPKFDLTAEGKIEGGISGLSEEDSPRMTKSPVAAAAAAAAAVAAAAVGGSTGKEILALGLNVTGDDVDLNKVSEYELNRAKECMDYKFKANQLKPGDPGYEYDLQVDFPPGMQENDWDEDSDVDDGEDAEYEPEVDWNEIHAKVKRN